MKLIVVYIVFKGTFSSSPLKLGQVKGKENRLPRLPEGTKIC